MHTATFTIPYPHFAETPAKTLPMQDSATTEPQSVTSRGHVDNHRRNQRDPTFCCCQVLRKCTHPHERDINRHRASEVDETSWPGGLKKKERKKGKHCETFAPSQIEGKGEKNRM
ncbi:uncharacterized protein LOC134740221 isoform X1 [Pongo pygmaeus]|uniref:uncharacterized protein LOC134740221 isoform X1 n=1 Tax=Pongo pygmaeus TaxID=9600 RepID=UPI00300D0E6F